MISTVSELKTYMRDTIAANHVDIDGFIYGNFDRVDKMLDEKGSFSRFLFMEWPESDPRDADGSYDNPLTVRVYLLSVVPSDDYDAQDEAMDRNMDIIVNEIIPRIREEAYGDGDYFQVSSNEGIRPVTFLSMGDVFGYYVDFVGGGWHDVNAQNASVWADR